MAAESRADAVQLADALRGQGQCGGLAGESEWQLPVSARSEESRRRLRTLWLSPALQPVDELCVVAAVWKGQKVGQWLVARTRRDRRRLADCRLQHLDAGRNGDACLQPGDELSGLVNHERFLGREQLSAQRQLRSVRSKGSAVDYELVQSVVRVSADRSQPAVRKRPAQ